MPRPRWSGGADDDPRARLVVAGCAGWLILVLLAQWPAPIFASFHSNSSIDAAFFAWGGQVIRDGGTPYLTFWDHKPPLIFLIEAAGLALAGGKVWGIWLFSLVSVLAALVLGYAALRRLLGETAAAFGSLAFAFALPAIMPWNLTEQYALPLQWGAILLLARGYDAPHRATRVGLGLGVLGALSLMLRPNLCGAAVVAAGALAWLWTRAGETGAVRRLGAGLAVGAAAVVAPIMGWLASRGALGAFYDQVVHYNALYTDAGIKQRLRAGYDGVRLAAVTLPLLVPLAGWILAVRHAVRQEPGPGSEPTRLVVLLWPVVEIAFAAVSGRAYAHYFTTVVPPFALLAGYLAAEITVASGAPLRAGTISPASILSALAIALAAPPPLDLLTRLRDSGLPRDRAESVAAVARFIRQNTAPSDRVLVWGHAADVHLFSGRRPASRFVYPLALLTPRYADSALVAGFLTEVRAADPALIVDATAHTYGGDALVPPLGTWDSTWRYPPISYTAGTYRPVWWRMTPALRAFYEYVDQRYVLVDSIGPGRWAVYRRR